MSPFVAEIAVKSAALLLAATALSLLLWKGSAALRHGLWTLCFLGLMLLPLLVVKLPTLPVERPVIVPSSPVPIAPYRFEPAKAAPTAPVPTQPIILPTPAPQPSFPWAAATVALWGLGVAVILLRSVGSIFRAIGIARRGQIHSTLNGVRTVFTSEVDVPMTFGLFRPVVLLPEAARAWSPERTEVVLLHEAAHITRRDWGWILLTRLVCAAYWPNPLVWWAEARLRAESEIAADDRVLGQGVSAIRYAESLVEIAADVRSRRRPAHALSVVEPGNLKSRVREILLAAKNRRPLTYRTAVVGLAIGGLAVFAFSASRFVPGAETVQNGVFDLGSGRSVSVVAITEMDGEKARSWNMDGELLREPMPVNPDIFRGEKNPAAPSLGTLRRYVVLRMVPEGDQSVYVRLSGSKEIVPTRFYSPPAGPDRSYSISTIGGTLLVCELDFALGTTGRFDLQAPIEEWRSYGRAAFRKGVRTETSNPRFQPFLDPETKRIAIDLPESAAAQKTRVRLSTASGVRADYEISQFRSGRETVFDGFVPAPTVTGIELLTQTFKGVQFRNIPLFPGSGYADEPAPAQLPNLLRANTGRVDLPDGSRIDLEAVGGVSDLAGQTWSAEGKPIAGFKIRNSSHQEPPPSAGEGHRWVRVQFKRSTASAGLNDSIFDGAGRSIITSSRTYEQVPGGMFDTTNLLRPSSLRTTSLVFKVVLNPERRVKRLKVDADAPAAFESTKGKVIEGLRVSLRPNDVKDLSDNRYQFVPLDSEGKALETRRGYSFDPRGMSVIFYGTQEESAKIRFVDIFRSPTRWVEFPDVRLYPNGEANP